MSVVPALRSNGIMSLAMDSLPVQDIASMGCLLLTTQTLHDGELLLALRTEAEIYEHEFDAWWKTYMDSMLDMDIVAHLNSQHYDGYISD